MWLKYFSQALALEPLLLLTSSQNLRPQPFLPPPSEDHFFTIVFNFYLVNYYTPAIFSIGLINQPSSEQVIFHLLISLLDVWDLLQRCLRTFNIEKIQNNRSKLAQITYIYILLIYNKRASKYYEEDWEWLKVLDSTHWEGTRTV